MSATTALTQAHHSANPFGLAPRPALPSAPTAPRRRVDTHCSIRDLEPLNATLKERVLGQEQALEPLVGSFSRFLSGLRDPGRPLLTALLLGPTGVGKTETARAIAQALLGSESSLLRIDCEEYAQGHEVAKLLGSPPGYVGHQVEPLLSQERLDAGHRRLVSDGVETESTPLLSRIAPDPQEGFVSIVLFDEIEKAHPTLWNTLLSLLEDGHVTLGDNSSTDLTRSVVLMTSNVGSAAMGRLAEPSLGFQSSGNPTAVDGGVLERTAMEAAHQRFPMEFLNRFDEVLVYSALEAEDLEKILDKFLVEIHRRALENEIPFLLKLDRDARDWILARGTDPRLGARPLRRTVERDLVGPLSRLIASEQLGAGAVVEVEVDGEELAFYLRESAEDVVL